MQRSLLILTLTVVATISTGCSSVCTYMFPNDYSKNAQMDQNRVCAKITIPI